MIPVIYRVTVLLNILFPISLIPQEAPVPPTSPPGPGRTLGGGQGPVIGLTGHLCVDEFRNKVMKEFSEFLPGGPQITGPRVPCNGFGGSPVGPGAAKQGSTAIGLGFKAHCCDYRLELGDSERF